MNADEQIKAAVQMFEAGELPEGSMLWRLAEFARWVAMGGCVIRDAHGNLIRMRFNHVQRRLLGACMNQAAQGQPIRIVNLKARKTGVSTFWQSLFVRLCQTCRNQIARTLAHKAEDTRAIFDIARRIVTHEREYPDEPLRTELTFPTDSTYSCHTAGGGGVGAGGTPSLLHLSEVALWSSVMTPERAEETEYSSTQAVPDVAETIIAYESTARGRDTVMWERFEQARKGIGPYTAIFVPWWEDSSNAMITMPSGFKRTDDEILMARQAADVGFELSDAQLEWHRQKGLELGRYLDQEFPSTPEDAIAARRDLVVPGLRACVVNKLPFVYERTELDGRVGGWDYGYSTSDPSAMVTGVIWDGILWVVDVSRGTELLATQMVREFTIWPLHKYYCDPSALGPRNELRAACIKAGIQAQFVQAPRGRGTKEEDRYADEWNRLRKYIVDGRLRIHKDASEQLILEADNLFYSPKTGRPEKYRAKNVGHFDTLDALRYMVCGVTLEQQVIPARRRAPTRREELRR